MQNRYIFKLEDLMKIKKRKTAKRKDPLVVNWWLREQISRELRWENDPKFWSKVFICYISGATFFVVGVACLLLGDLTKIGWAIGYLLNILLGLGLSIASGLCHYSRSRNPEPLLVLFKELHIYGRKHDQNVKSLRSAIRTKKDDFNERRGWQLLEQKLARQKLRWEEITHAVYALRRADALDDFQLQKVHKLTQEVRQMGINLLPEDSLLSGLAKKPKQQTTAA